MYSIKYFYYNRWSKLLISQINLPNTLWKHCNLGHILSVNCSYQKPLNKKHRVNQQVCLILTHDKICFPVPKIWLSPHHLVRISLVIIQYIVMLGKYIHGALNIRHPYQTLPCDIGIFYMSGRKMTESFKQVTTSEDRPQLPRNNTMLC